MFNYAGVLAAFVIGAVCLGPIVGLVLAGIAWYAPQAWLTDKVQSRGKDIDKVLPIAVGRIAAGLLAGGSPSDVLQQVAASLELEGPNPLSPELSLTATEMRTKDRREALYSLANVPHPPRSPTWPSCWKAIWMRVAASMPKP